MGEVRVAPVAGIAITHVMHDGIALERRDAVDWPGTVETEAPLIIRHEVGRTDTRSMREVLRVPPWCTFHIDTRREPAAHFPAIFGEVDRLLTADVPGSRYVVRYAVPPGEPVIALQSELLAFSFALAARGRGLIAHACAFVTPNGNGVLCPGVSGTGKTTLAGLVARVVPDAVMLTDDRAVITSEDGGPRVWGSPWPGAARIAGSESAPLDTVVFIRHGAEPSLRPVPAAAAFRRIVNTLSMPLWEPARCGSALETVDAVVTRARLVEATFPPTEEAARWLCDELGVPITAVGA